MNDTSYSDFIMKTQVGISDNLTDLDKSLIDRLESLKDMSLLDQDNKLMALLGITEDEL